MLNKIKNKELWEYFFNYKLTRERAESPEVLELRDFIDKERYLYWSEKIVCGTPFSHPKKVLINKARANKKRVVYVFPGEENIVLKFISFLLKEYDCFFAPNLYSFRKKGTVSKAINKIIKTKNINRKYVYKVDIDSYFNSVNVDKLFPMLDKCLGDNINIVNLLRQLLLDSYVLFNDEVLPEKKGIIPGAPISAFLANLYLNDLDYYFYNNGILYARYSDDIIVFADTKDELEGYVSVIKNFLEEKDLSINSDKEVYYLPGEKWEFLGYSYCNGIVDVSTISLKKLKAKMRRKTEALARWAARKKLPKQYAAKAFVNRFNAKLYDNPVNNELTWTRWYFPIINTTKTLKEIDEYMQYCIRVLATGKKTKKRYEFRYEDIKKLGYRNLVNEYYKSKENTELPDCTTT